jgi:hypothetical protein
MSKHPHAECIAAWAQGTPIQFRSARTHSWIDLEPPEALKQQFPAFVHDWEYRIKPHRWQHCIDAFKAGKTIEYRYMLGASGVPGPWQTHTSGVCTDVPAFEYRIKPEVVRYRRVVRKHSFGFSYVDTVIDHPQVQQPQSMEESGDFVRWVDTEWQEVSA